MDLRSTPRIGYGHLITGDEYKVLGNPLGKSGDSIDEFKISKEDAEKLLIHDLKTLTKQVHENLPDLSIFMKQYQIDSILSFAYSVGLNSFLNSNIFDSLKNRNLTGTSYFFKSYIRENGIKKLDLIKRRAVEKFMFQTGDNIFSYIFSDKLDPYKTLDLPKGD